MLAGSGYRAVLGYVVLVVNILMIAVGQYLLYVRRNHHPIKAHNPVLLSLMLYHLLGNTVWIAFSEIGWVSFSCGDQLLWMNSIAVWFGFPIFVWAYRLILINDFEKRKLVYALAQRTSSPYVNEHEMVQLYKFHRNSRLVGWSMLGCLPPFIFVPIFLHFDTSWDWSAPLERCTLRNYGLITLGVSAVYLSTCTAILMYLFVKNKVNDAWGIRKSLMELLGYGNLFVMLFIVLNLVYPDVNANMFQTGHILNVESLVTCAHLVFYPLIKSYFISQQHLLSPEERLAIRIDTHAANRAAAIAAGVDSKAGGGGAMETVPEPSKRAISYTSKRRPAGGLFRVLSDPRGYRLFLAYCSSEFSAEAVMFYSACDEFRALPSVAAAERIWRTFVAPHAKLQVNLSHPTASSLKTALESYGVSTARVPTSKPVTPILGAPPTAGGANVSHVSQSSNDERKQTTNDTAGANAAPASTSGANAPNVAGAGGGGRLPPVRNPKQPRSLPPRVTPIDENKALDDALTAATLAATGMRGDAPAVAPRPSGSKNGGAVAAASVGTPRAITVKPKPPTPLLSPAIAASPLMPGRRVAEGVSPAAPSAVSANSAAGDVVLPPPAAAASSAGAVVSPVAGSIVIGVNASTPTAGSGAAGSPERFAHVFDDAQKETFGLLECDSFSRFVHTASGRECAHLWDPNHQPPDSTASPHSHAPAAAAAAAAGFGLHAAAAAAPDTPTAAASANGKPAVSARGSGVVGGGSAGGSLGVTIAVRPAVTPR